jgi:hypothetical protein
MHKLIAFSSFLIGAALLLAMEAKGQSETKDAVYKFGDFLISAEHPTKIDFLVKNKKFKNLHKKDTLYEDNKYLILGDTGVLASVYKKYKVPYRYSDFKADVYKGMLAPPDFKTDTAAWLFRTQIKTQCKANAVNFAGHFTVVMWGCGSDCREYAIVDRITGRIHFTDIYKGFDYPFKTIAYKPNSTMVMMDEWMLEGFKGYVRCHDLFKLRTALWDHVTFRLLTTQN